MSQQLCRVGLQANSCRPACRWAVRRRRIAAASPTWPGPSRKHVNPNEH
jgi:hypothetical protein